MSSISPVTRGVHHIGLSVSDLQASILFFTRLLNFSIMAEKPAYPAAILSDTQTMITLWQVEDPDTCTSFDRRKNVGLHHLALAMENETALLALYAKLTDANITFEFPPEPRADGKAMHMMTLIPGGPRVEFVCPT
ncbi:MAG: VOC family protein [Hyphomonas sp.]